MMARGGAPLGRFFGDEIDFFGGGNMCAVPSRTRRRRGGMKLCRFGSRWRDGESFEAAARAAAVGPRGGVFIRIATGFAKRTPREMAERLGARLRDAGRRIDLAGPLRLRPRVCRCKNTGVPGAEPPSALPLSRGDPRRTASGDSGKQRETDGDGGGSDDGASGVDASEFPAAAAAAALLFDDTFAGRMLQHRASAIRDFSYRLSSAKSSPDTSTDGLCLTTYFNTRLSVHGLS